VEYGREAGIGGILWAIVGRGRGSWGRLGWDGGSEFFFGRDLGFGKPTLGRSWRAGDKRPSFTALPPAGVAMFILFFLFFAVVARG
jgi:hypothetical protein